MTCIRLGVIAGAACCLLLSTSCRTTMAPLTWEDDSGGSVAAVPLRLNAERLSLRSGALLLEPLRLYEITATIACGPGTRHRFEVHYTDASGEPEVRMLVWQYISESRPDWLPFPPPPRRYRQAFILPEGARDAYFEVRIEPPRQPAAAPLTTLEISDVQVKARKSVPLTDMGANQLFNGDMELPTTGTLPSGWNTWGETVGCELVEAADAQSGRHYLRLGSGQGIYLQPGELAAVTPGTAWRLSFWVRGKGSMNALVHSLNDSWPPWRVGDAQMHHYTIDSAEWTHHEQLWFAESPALYSAQILFSIRADDHVDIDSVEFQPYIR